MRPEVIRMIYPEGLNILIVEKDGKAMFERGIVKAIAEDGKVISEIDGRAVELDLERDKFLGLL